MHKCVTIFLLIFCCVPLGLEAAPSDNTHCYMERGSKVGTLHAPRVPLTPEEIVLEQKRLELVGEYLKNQHELDMVTMSRGGNYSIDDSGVVKMLSPNNTTPATAAINTRNAWSSIELLTLGAALLANHHMMADLRTVINNEESAKAIDIAYRVAALAVTNIAAAGLLYWQRST